MSIDASAAGLQAIEQPFRIASIENDETSISLTPSGLWLSVYRSAAADKASMPAIGCHERHSRVQSCRIDVEGLL